MRGLRCTAIDPSEVDPSEVVGTWSFHWASQLGPGDCTDLCFGDSKAQNKDNFSIGRVLGGFRYADIPPPSTRACLPPLFCGMVVRGSSGSNVELCLAAAAGDTVIAMPATPVMKSTKAIGPVGSFLSSGSSEGPSTTAGHT